MIRIAAFFLGLLLALSPLRPALADSFSDDQKKEMGDIIHSYLLEHPEVIKEMVQILDAKDKKATEDAQAQALTAAGKDIFHDNLDAIVGNPKGDVTMVEFMDYNCGYCKKDLAEVQSVVAQDPNLKVVMKEWPIFGPDSEFAAKAAMAAAKQGKYWALHQALFSNQGHVDQAVVEKLAKSVGIDVAKMKADMADKAIADNLDKTQSLATSLQFSGTPGFLIGDVIVPGYIDRGKLLATIADIRAKGGCSAC